MAKKRQKGRAKPKAQRRRNGKGQPPRVPATKGKKLRPEPLTRDEVKALLEACPTTWTGVRDRALLTLLWRSGLRIAEAVALTPKDVDKEMRTIRVLHGKGDRFRTVSMDPHAFTALEPWLEIRRDLGATISDPFFCTQKKTRLDPSHLRHLLPKLAHKAKISKRVHPHGFRHTCAAELASEGVAMNVIQAQLGHSNLGTTSTYLAHIAPTQLVNTMRSRPDWSSVEPPTENTTQSTTSKRKQPRKQRKKPPPRKV